MAEQFPLDYFEEYEKGHGRHSSWHVSVFNALYSPKTKEWENLSRFIHVHKITTKNGRTSHSDRLYITNHLKTDAHFFHNGIRGHWAIENNLHWVKDVIHGEDSNRIRNKNGAVNTAVFSSVAINIHHKNGYESITEAQVKSSVNFKELLMHIFSKKNLEKIWSNRT